MASKYNPKRILQLLSICSWKNQNTLDYLGFGDLSNAINTYLIQNKETKFKDDVKQNYLSDLYSKSKLHLEKGETINRNKTNIRQILKYIGFNDWEHFDKQMTAFESYLDWSKTDFSKFQTINLSVLCQGKSESRLESILNFISSHFQVPIVLDYLNSNEADAILTTLSEKQKNYPSVVWCISDDWNSVLTEYTNQIEVYLKSGQILPIRFGKTLDQSDLTISFIPDTNLTSGLAGFLMALALIDMALTLQKLDSKTSETVFGAKNSMTIQNNSGTIFSGDNLQIKGENVALRDFVQNVNPKSKDDE